SLRLSPFCGRSCRRHGTSRNGRRSLPAGGLAAIAPCAHATPLQLMLGALPMWRRMPSRSTGCRPARLRFHPRLAALLPAVLCASVRRAPGHVRGPCTGPFALTGLIQTEVVVVGGGPAGAVAGRALACLGRDVVLCEAARFPRAHVGVSLSAGVAKQLAFLGLDRLLDLPCHRRNVPALRRWGTADFEIFPGP